jgi:hypothetical protein
MQEKVERKKRNKKGDSMEGKKRLRKKWKLSTLVTKKSAAASIR